MTLPGYCGISFHHDADAGVVIRRGADRTLRQHIADDIAVDAHDGYAFVEVGDRHPDRADVDGVVGDHRAFEGELRIERDFAYVADAVAGDVNVRRRIAAHGGIIAIARSGCR